MKWLASTKQQLTAKYGYLIMPFWLKIYPWYYKIIIKNKKKNTNNQKQKEEAFIFYKQNSSRVQGVVNMLADEFSKKIFLGLVKYRQTHLKEDFPNYECEKHYFIKELKFSNDEVFIDCGAYTGDTISTFLKNCPNYAYIVAFEPDRHNFAELKKNHGINNKIVLHNAGVYDYDGEIRFKMIGCGRSKIISEDDGITGAGINVKTIDNLSLNKVTFIKMDIEGAELNALKGAEKTILRDKPKLAISIYHSNEEMLCIAEYIHALIPDYQLLIRHHPPEIPSSDEPEVPSIDETVLYAFIP